MARKSHVIVEGLPELREKLAQTMPRAAANIARRVVVKIARLTRDEARKRVAVDTGILKKNIKSRRTRGQRISAEHYTAEAKVYVDGDAKSRWHFVEYGTAKHPAQPFLVPAAEAMRPRLTSLYRQGWGIEFEKEMAKKAKGARRV